MLYLALRLAREVLKESRRQHCRKRKPLEHYRSSRGTSTSVIVVTGGGSGSWTNARIP